MESSTRTGVEIEIQLIKESGILLNTIENL